MAEANDRKSPPLKTEGEGIWGKIPKSIRQKTVKKMSQIVSGHLETTKVIRGINDDARKMRPILGQETYIEIRPRRAQCPSCLHKPTTTQTLAWYDQRSPHTKAYDRYLMKLLIGSTVADVSLKENLGYDAVLGALERQVDDEVNWDEVQNLGTIGIDEVAHKKGRRSYRAVVTARQDDGTVLILTVLKDRKKRR